MIVLPGNRCCLAKGVRVLVSSTSRTVNNAVVDETSNLRGSISVQPISEAARKKEEELQREIKQYLFDFIFAKTASV